MGEAEKAKEQTDALFDILQKTDVNQTKAVIFELAEKIKQAILQTEQRFNISVTQKKLLTMRTVIESKSLNEIYTAIQKILSELNIAINRIKSNGTKATVR